MVMVRYSMYDVRTCVICSARGRALSSQTHCRASWASSRLTLAAFSSALELS